MGGRRRTGEPARRIPRNPGLAGDTNHQGRCIVPMNLSLHDTQNSPFPGWHNHHNKNDLLGGSLEASPCQAEICQVESNLSLLWPKAIRWILHS